MAKLLHKSQWKFTESLNVQDVGFSTKDEERRRITAFLSWSGVKETDKHMIIVWLWQSLLYTSTTSPVAIWDSWYVVIAKQHANFLDSIHFCTILEVWYQNVFQIFFNFQSHKRVRSKKLRVKDKLMHRFY